MIIAEGKARPNWSGGHARAKRKTRAARHARLAGSRLACLLRDLPSAPWHLLRCVILA